MMKRLIVALTIIAGGGVVFSMLRASAARSSAELASSRDALAVERESLAQAQKRHTELTTRIRDLKHEIEAQPHGGIVSETPLAKLILTNGTIGTNHLTPEIRERLLAELGFNWNQTGDYVVVSKDSLSKLSVEAVRQDRLTDTVCSVLAIQPEERAAIESVMGDVTGELKAWAMSHAQRTEPQGDVLAKYSVPLDSEFSQSLSNEFAAGVVGALGTERAGLLLDYATSWMLDMRMEGDRPTTLTVRRPAGDPERLSIELQTPDGGTMYTDVSPHQPFPYVFRSLFPDGWAGLAQREGFELPKEFKK